MQTMQSTLQPVSSNSGQNSKTSSFLQQLETTDVPRPTQPSDGEAVREDFTKGFVIAQIEDATDTGAVLQPIWDGEHGYMASQSRGLPSPNSSHRVEL